MASENEQADMSFWLKDAAGILRQNGTTMHAEWVEKAARALQPQEVVERARYVVAKEIADQRAGTYLIAGYLRGDLDDSAAIQNAIANLTPPIQAAESGLLEEVLREMALAAGALTVATDGEEHLRPQRQRVLEAMQRVQILFAKAGKPQSER